LLRQQSIGARFREPDCAKVARGHKRAQHPEDLRIVEPELLRIRLLWGCALSQIESR